MAMTRGKHTLSPLDPRVGVDLDGTVARAAPRMGRMTRTPAEAADKNGQQQREETSSLPSADATAVRSSPGSACSDAYYEALCNDASVQAGVRALNQLRHTAWPVVRAADAASPDDRVQTSRRDREHAQSPISDAECVAVAMLQLLSSGLAPATVREMTRARARACQRTPMYSAPQGRPNLHVKPSAMDPTPGGAMQAESDGQPSIRRYVKAKSANTLAPKKRGRPRKAMMSGNPTADTMSLQKEDNDEHLSLRTSGENAGARITANFTAFPARPTVNVHRFGRGSPMPTADATRINPMASNDITTIVSSDQIATRFLQEGLQVCSTLMPSTAIEPVKGVQCGDHVKNIDDQPPHQSIGQEQSPTIQPGMAVAAPPSATNVQHGAQFRTILPRSMALDARNSTASRLTEIDPNVAFNRSSTSNSTADASLLAGTKRVGTVVDGPRNVRMKLSWFE